jgi:acyl-CoA thioester hydrolase
VSAAGDRSRIEIGTADARDLAGDFGHRHVVQVRFADTDAMGHVNNAAYLTFVEAARIDWWAAVAGEPILREPARAEGLILAEASVAFRAPVFFGDRVVVETRATGIGRTSLALEHRVTAQRDGEPCRLVATCQSVIVRYDYVEERPTPFLSELVERVEAFEGRTLRA